MADNEFHDPLDDVIARATGRFANNDIPTEQSVPHPVNDVPTEPEVNYVDNDTIDFNDVDVDDDPYGANDLQREMEEEDRLREEQLNRELEEKKALKEEAEQSTKLPPQSLDPKFQKEAIDFQTDNLSIVTGMVEQVKAKYHLKGGIKQEILPIIMGDLMEEYYNNGETITPRFEEIIMNNWTHVDANGEEYNANEPAQNAPTQETGNDAQPVTVNIDVAPDQPVTVNIDDEALGDINKTKVININVREVTDMDMERVTVIENSQKEGVIRSFEIGSGFTPITLPLSAYRCQIKPLNFFDMINMLSPDGTSKVDFHLKRWRIIYDHLKNPSIGDFTDFEDFLKKTKFADMSIMEWGVLAATSSDDEQLGVVCGNPKCKKDFTHTYSPRTLVHPNPDRLPKEFNEIANASGKGAIDLFNRVSGKRRRYKLPMSKLIIEINEPSAYEYLTIKLPLIITKYAERIPEDPNMDNFNEETLQTGGDPRLNEFAYKMALMMRISAIIVPPPESDNFDTPHEYRFTNWDDIEEQIQLLPMEDTIALIKLVGNHEDFASPIDFYVSDVKCPFCGRVEPQIPVNNLITNLLFRVSRRLQNTEINLIELD